jgi:hypothetical protein
MHELVQIKLLDSSETVVETSRSLLRWKFHLELDKSLAVMIHIAKAAVDGEQRL